MVPDDAAELVAELRRHGLRPGQRLHLRAVPDPAEADTDAGQDDPWDAFIDLIGQYANLDA